MLSKRAAVIIASIIFAVFALFGCSNGTASSAGSSAASASASDPSAAFVGTWYYDTDRNAAQAGVDEDFLNLYENGTLEECSITGGAAKVTAGTWKATGDNAASVNVRVLSMDNNLGLTLEGDALALKGQTGTVYYKRGEAKEVPSNATIYGEILEEYENPITIVDDDDVVIKVLAKGQNLQYEQDCGFVLSIENKTDAARSYNAKDFSVNGAMCIAQFLSTGSVGAGKHDDHIILTFLPDSGVSKIDDLKDVDGTITSVDYEKSRTGYSLDEVTNYAFHVD